LELRKKAGDITDWWFETWRGRLADNTFYCPDFLILHNTGLLECVETKGHLEEAAGVRFKVARERFYFFKWTMLGWDKRRGGWYEKLKAKGEERIPT